MLKIIMNTDFILLSNICNNYINLKKMFTILINVVKI